MRNICAKFGIPNLSQSPDIGQNSDGSIFNFWFSGQSLMNKNCQNSGVSHDIDMNVRPVPKIDSKNTETSKILDNDVISAICDVIVFFSIYGQFAAIRKPDSGYMI